MKYVVLAASDSPSKTLPIMKWIEALGTYLKIVLVVQNIPLAYLIRGRPEVTPLPYRPSLG